nr:GNAT family N-acetyltransferase [Lacticaseibacillus camelliae]
MTIRELHDSDDAEYRQLLKYAFDWSMDDDEEKANIMEFQHASAWGIGEPLVSALTAIHLDVRMGETTFKMAGVSDVASYPEASGQAILNCSCGERWIHLLIKGLHSRISCRFQRLFIGDSGLRMPSQRPPMRSKRRGCRR